MLSSYDLRDAEAGGLIAEDVLREIFEHAPRDMPFTEMARSDSADNTYTEWLVDDLPDVNANNAVIEGADADRDDSELGNRVGNRVQLSDKQIKLSTTSTLVQTLGMGAALEYQTRKLTAALRLDIEAIALGAQA